MASKNGRIDQSGQSAEPSSNAEDTLSGGPNRCHDGTASIVNPESSAQRLERRGATTEDRPPAPGDDDSAQLARRLLKPQIVNHGCPGDPLWEQFPTVGAMFFRGSWNGVVPRKPALLTIAVRPTGLQFTLKMPTEGKQVRDNVSYFHDLLPRLEQCLTHMLGDWSDLTSGPGATYKREQRKKLLAKSDSPI